MRLDGLLMLKNEATLGMEKRNALFRILREKSVSFSSKLALSEYMAGMTEREKEVVAEQLSRIVSESNSEEEMLQRAEEELTVTPIR